MPLYEYQCKECQHRFEKIQKFSDAPVKKCPKCGGRVEKLLSPPAVQFKGSGWYVTDYARKGKETSEASSASDAGGGTAAKDAAKTDKSDKSDSKKAEKKPAKK